MTAAGLEHPVRDGEAEVTTLRRVSVSVRVEAGDPAALVLRPSIGDFVSGEVVRVGEVVEVFWHGPEGGRALPAEVVHVQAGAAPRWHLAVTGPAEDSQRRTAVRARLALEVVVTMRGIDLAGESVDLSEAGLRADVEGYGADPEPGTTLGVSLLLEDGAVWTRAEVVRVQSRHSRWLLSLRFVDIAERDQDRLRRRVFQALREQRARVSPDGG
ncbi:flagellar brake protein [Blastococcus sp. SYSU D00820]